MAKKLVVRNGKLVIEDDSDNTQIPIPKGYNREDTNLEKISQDPFKRSPFEPSPEVMSAKNELLDAIGNLIEGGENAPNKLGLGLGARHLGELTIPTDPVGMGLAAMMAPHAIESIGRNIPPNELMMLDRKMNPLPLESEADKIRKGTRAIEDRVNRSNELLNRRATDQGLEPFKEYQGVEKRHNRLSLDVEPEGELKPFTRYQGLPKLTKESGVLRIPSKNDRALALIKRSGGTDIQVNENNIATWRDSEGKAMSADLNKRFGTRNLQMNPRTNLTNPRSPLLNELNKAAGNPPTSAYTRQKELEKRIQEGMSSHRTKYEDDPFHGFREGDLDKYDFEPGGKGLEKKPTIKEGLKEAKENLADLFKRKPGDEEMLSGLPPMRLKDKMRANRPIPEDFKLDKSFKAVTNYQGTPLRFASDFDKMAYTLASSTKPQPKVMQNIIAQLTEMGRPMTEEAIMNHGKRIMQMVEKLPKPKPAAIKGMTGKALDIPARPIVEELDRPKMTAGGFFKELMVGPSQTKFGGDISPLLRQSYRANLLHPIQTGIPAFKHGMQSITQQGFDDFMEELAMNSPVYKRLEQYAAMPGTTERLFPNIKELHKLAAHDLGEYYTESAPLESIPGLGDLYLKPSRRMFEAAQKSSRGTEVERLAKQFPGGLDALLEGGDEEGKILRNIINRVNDETGHGTLGSKGDKALDVLSYGLTAPRNLAAKFQFYNPLNYLPEGIVNKAKLGGLRRDIGSGIAYKDFLKDQAKLLGGTGAGLYALNKSGAADVEPNPYAANFGVRFGNYKPDLFGGEASLVRQLIRGVTPGHTARISSRGNEYDREDNYGNDWKRFFAGRVRPGIPTMALDYAFGGDPDTGKKLNYLREDISKPYQEDELGHALLGGSSGFGDTPYSRWIAQQFSNANLADIMDASKEGTGTGLAAGALAFLGGGSSTYDPFEDNPYKPPKLFIRVPVRKPGKYEKTHNKKPSETTEEFIR